MQLKSLLPKVLGGVLIIIAGGSLAGNVYQYKKIQSLQADPQLMANVENEQLIATVGKLMVLPDEKPTIATVTDPDKLKDQPFFAKAKVGDKVLMYTAAKFAILYDPVAGKIVEKAPLVQNDAKNQPGDGMTPDENDDSDTGGTSSSTNKNVNSAKKRP